MLLTVRLEVDYNDPQKREDLFISLLHIDHLKEMGRANLNMDLYTRDNFQARYEYIIGIEKAGAKALLKQKGFIPISKKLKIVLAVVLIHW